MYSTPFLRILCFFRLCPLSAFLMPTLSTVTCISVVRAKLLLYASTGVCLSPPREREREREGGIHVVEHIRPVVRYSFRTAEEPTLAW